MSELIENRYKILKLIGQGGMSKVYLARDVSTDKSVAIKIMHETEVPRLFSLKSHI